MTCSPCPGRDLSDPQVAAGDRDADVSLSGINDLISFLA
jgi:hypothetical protein